MSAPNIQSRVFDRWSEFCSGPPGERAIFLWALGEATVWPVLPDALLVPMAVTGHNTQRLLRAALAGMAIGGTASYLYAYAGPNAAAHLLERLPLTRADGIETAGARLKRHGAKALWLQPYSGIPMKVWAAAGGCMRLHPARVIPTFVAARTLRMAFTAGVAHLLGGQFRQTVRRHFLILVGLYVGGFLSVWLRMVREDS